MSRSKTVSGAKVVCYINNRAVGVVTSFSWTSSTPRRKIHCIDIPYPVELAATTSDISWQMQLVRTIGDGGAQGIGIATESGLISREKYFTIQLIERTSNLTIFRADYCQTDSENWSVAPKGLMMGNISGSGIAWANETATAT